MAPGKHSAALLRAQHHHLSHQPGHHRGSAAPGLGRRLRASRPLLLAGLAALAAAVHFLHGHYRLSAAFRDMAAGPGGDDGDALGRRVSRRAVGGGRTPPVEPYTGAPLTHHAVHRSADGSNALVKGASKGARSSRRPQPRGAAQGGGSGGMGPQGEELPRQQLPGGLVQPAQWRVMANGAAAAGPATTFAYTHMGMLAELPDERLAVAFQASAVLEAAEDQRIWVMLSRDVRGREWAPPHPLLPEHRSAAQWAPVLHWSAAQARLYMFYAESLPRCLRAKHGSQPRRYSVGGDIKMTWAEAPLAGAEAVEWQPPSYVYRQRDGDKPTPKVIANRLLELTSGEWVLPFWRQRSYQVCETKGAPNAAGVLVSGDAGQTWAAHGELTLPQPAAHWVIEGSALELRNGTLLLLLRSTEGFVYSSMSTDRGRTWGQVFPTAVRNPDAKVHAISLPSPDDRLALAFNDHDRPFHGMAKGRGGASGKRRDTLTLAVSPDSGASWKPVARLDPPVSVTSHGQPAQAMNLMSHYPTMLPRRSGALLVAYSRAYYPDRSQVDPPLLDGIWLAELEADDLSG